MKEQNSYKYLFKNIGLLTLSDFATKILSFFLVPLYTNVLSTEEYGVYDLFSVTVAVLLPILTLNIQESVLRFSLDRESSNNAIVSIGTKYLILSNFIVILGIVVNSFLDFDILFGNYALLFLLLYFTQSLSGLLISYVRGSEKIKYLSISSVISTIVTIVANIVFLIVFKLGLVGYFLANIIGPLTQCVYLIFKSDYIFCIKIGKYKNDEIKMLKYSKPLIINSVAWWFNSVSDRYVVSFICGFAENGIYSVAGKIPAILNVIQNVFNQAWALSAIKDFDSEDRKGFFSNTYSGYNSLLTIFCSFIILFDKLFSNILFSKDFYSAWKYVPWLTIATLFGALSGYVGGIFAAVKDSRLYSYSTIFGAFINLILNFLFTPLIGAMGAAISTTISYVFVWSFRLIQSKKYIKLNVKIYRDLLSYFLLVVQASCLLLDGWMKYIIISLIFILILILYYRDFVFVILKMFEVLKNRGKK